MLEYYKYYKYAWDPLVRQFSSVHDFDKSELK